MLSPGQDHDLTCAQPLIEAVDPGALIADKAFDADACIAALNDRAIVPVIPSTAMRFFSASSRRRVSSPAAALASASSSALASRIFSSRL